MSPRDVLLTFASEVLEATKTYRCAGSNILPSLDENYFSEDPNFCREAAPIPRLTKAEYPPITCPRNPQHQTLKRAARKFFVTTEEGPPFDAVCILLTFELIRVKLRDACEFGGGLHCFTADVYHDGSCTITSKICHIEEFY